MVLLHRWSKEAGFPKGHPVFRYMAALSAWAQEDFGTACANFPFAENPGKCVRARGVLAVFRVEPPGVPRFADMMTEWSQKGYPSERDLFLTKGVLM